MAHLFSIRLEDRRLSPGIHAVSVDSVLSAKEKTAFFEAFRQKKKRPVTQSIVDRAVTSELNRRATQKQKKRSYSRTK